VDGTYSRTYEGTGLGLALVRRMVELQGGEVTVRSKPGEGTRFTCRFADCLRSRVQPIKDRLREAESAPEMPSPRVDDDREAGRTILIVEDNSLNRKLARNVLKTHGYRILEAESAEIALKLLAAHRPDLVLMDLQLPGLDGLELTRRLTADPRNVGMPIVALTAHALEADEEKARAAGCVGFITKPIRLSEFPGQVAAHLPVAVESPVG
jgi:CheY-like chemotaxis protein